MSEQISNDTAAKRYVIADGDQEMGFVTYTDHGDRISLDHTIVHPEHQGKGVAGKVVRFALDDLRTSSDARIEPVCSYVVDFVRKHPEYADLTTR